MATSRATSVGWVTFLAFRRYLRNLYPAETRIAIVFDNCSPHLSPRVDTRVGDWVASNNVEFAYVRTKVSWLNRIEAQFQALRYFTLDGTDRASHEEQNSMIRRYIRWRNINAHDKTLWEVVGRANFARVATRTGREEDRFRLTGSPVSSILGASQGSLRCSYITGNQVWRQASGIDPRRERNEWQRDISIVSQL